MTPVFIQLSLSVFKPYQITPFSSIQNKEGSKVVSSVIVSLSVRVNDSEDVLPSSPFKVTVTVVVLPSTLLLISTLYLVLVSLSGIV